MIVYNKGKSYEAIYQINKPNKVSKILLILLGILILCLFLPWTQNIRTKGKVTTLRQEQRAQNINTTLPGRIVKWYIQEGETVNVGDTIAQIAEIKDDYLDPKLLQRTKEQINAKQQSIEYYQGKRGATEQQIQALHTGLEIKTAQLKNKVAQQRLKVRSDSATLVAAKNDYQIATKQYNRQKELYDQGLVSLAQLEQRNMTLQTSQARLESAQNNLSNSRQDVHITQLELGGVQQENLDKISKARGEIMQALSQVATGEGETAKLQNQYSNYALRNKLYYIIAPQEGQIVQAKRSGIGEILKEGETLVQIVPKQIDYAVELFITPLDVPLVNVGQKIRFIFDGFPAIVFSGWPTASYGTFGGVVTAIENNVTNNGTYRILVKEDNSDKAWPEAIRLGTGAQAIALLKDVPIWYEIWRNINGFPADFYKPNNLVETTDKK